MTPLLLVSETAEPIRSVRKVEVVPLSVRVKRSSMPDLVGDDDAFVGPSAYDKGRQSKYSIKSLA
jgi:hypothetical protein